LLGIDEVLITHNERSECILSDGKGGIMWYVYILESERTYGKFYTGITNDLKRRLKEHNSIENKGYTSKYQPWKIHTYLGFTDKNTAENFEKYLKTQAGRRFQKLRLQYTSF
jgi:predicted GIY-YIG superfamily endonuclease